MMAAWKKSGSRATLGFATVLTAPAAVAAADLLIFERPGYSYGAASDREITTIYPLTSEGMAIPAHRVDITRPLPADFDFVKVERLTPVIVLVDNGREIGRFRGYAWG